MAIQDEGGNGRPARLDKTKRVDVHKQVDHPDSIAYELTPEEIEEIRAEARATVAKEVKKQKEKAYLEQFLKEERQTFVPEKRLVPIFLQLPGFTNYIMLDGVQFFHDHVYHVEPGVAQVLAEQVARGHAHEQQTQVQDTKTRRRWTAPQGLGYGNFTGDRSPRNMTINPSQAGMPAESLIGVKL